MSEIVLHTAYLSEAYQLRLSYLFDVATKQLEQLRPGHQGSATEIWVLDAHSPATALTHKPPSACVLLIAAEHQHQALQAQWDMTADGLLAPDYNVQRLTQALEQMTLKAHGKRLRSTLKTRRAIGATMPAELLDFPPYIPPAITPVASNMAPAVATPSQVAAKVEASSADNAPDAGTRFSIKRWTQLTGSQAGQSHRQALAMLISGERTMDELCERARLNPSEALRLIQVLRGKGLLIEIEAPAPSLATATVADAANAANAQAPKARSLFRQLTQWISHTRKPIVELQA